MADAKPDARGSRSLKSEVAFHPPNVACQRSGRTPRGNHGGFRGLGGFEPRCSWRRLRVTARVSFESRLGLEAFAIPERQRAESTPQTISFRANALKCRRIVGAGNSGRFAPTSWWWTQSCETGLRRPNSLLTGKITGNISIFGCFGRNLLIETSAFSVPYEEIP
jgi:hypothetical protein